MLYYGDEAGMQGFEDPFNRGTYPWGRENAELVQYFQQLGALRKSHEALQSGTIVYHAAQGRALAFSRRTEHDHCLTAVNAGDEPVTLTLPWDGTLAERRLTTGLANWEYTEVVSGLAAGERVVSSLERVGVKAGARYVPDEKNTARGAGK